MPSLKRMAASLFPMFLLVAGSFAQAPAPQAPAAVPAEKTVAATVGTEAITEAEVQATVQSQLRGQPVPPEVAQQIRGMVLEALIEKHLVTQFIAAKKVAADPVQVEAAMNQIKASAAQRGIDLSQALQAQGLTEPALRERIGEQLAFEKYAESQATDQKLQEYFTGHKREFDGSEVKASHILIKVDADETPEQRKAASEKIAAIRQEVAAGLDFAEAARKYSGCPSSAEGGDLGFFGRHNQMVEPFAAAAFALPVGQVSEPVETQFGYHLIKVTDTKQGERTFEEAKDEVRQTLFQKIWEDAAAEQRKVTKVEISKG